MRIAYENPLSGIRIYEDSDGIAHEVRTEARTMAIGFPSVSGEIADADVWIDSMVTVLERQISRDGGEPFGDRQVEQRPDSEWPWAMFVPDAADRIRLEVTVRYWPAEPKE